MKKISFIFIGIFIMLMNVSCSKNPVSSKDSKNINIVSLKGYIQKGPFLSGTSVDIYELNEKLNQLGNSFTSHIENNKGLFRLDSVDLSSKYVRLKANGYFFNEITGKKSESQITLFSLSNITNRNTININVLSHLETPRVEYLIEEKGKGFLEAKNQALQEILNIFDIQDSISHSEDLNILKEGKSNNILLAVSSILLGKESEGNFTELLSDIRGDIKKDGSLDDSSSIKQLKENAKSLNLDEIKINLENRCKELELYSDSMNIEGFKKYVYNFIKKDEYIVKDSNIVTMKDTTGKKIDSVFHSEDLSKIKKVYINDTLKKEYFYDLDGCFELLEKPIHKITYLNDSVAIDSSFFVVSPKLFDVDTTSSKFLHSFKFRRRDKKILGNTEVEFFVSKDEIINDTPVSSKYFTSSNKNKTNSVKYQCTVSGKITNKIKFNKIPQIIYNNEYKKYDYLINSELYVYFNQHNRRPIKSFIWMNDKNNLFDEDLYKNYEKKSSVVNSLPVLKKCYYKYESKNQNIDRFMYEIANNDTVLKVTKNYSKLIREVEKKDTSYIQDLNNFDTIKEIYEMNSLKNDIQATQNIMSYYRKGNSNIIRGTWDNYFLNKKE